MLYFFIINFLLMVVIQLSSTVPLNSTQGNETANTDDYCRIEEYSRAVIILQGYRLWCGGSLLSKKWVLTAARCGYNVGSHSMVFVYAGVQTWTGKGYFVGHEQLSKIEDVVFSHKSSEEQLDEGICLMKLKDEMVETEKVKFAKIPSTKEFEQLIDKGECKTITAMGYQQDSVNRFNSEWFSLDGGLKCITLEPVKKKTCDKYSKIIRTSIMCATDPLGKGNCFVDTGYPLLCNNVQIGVLANKVRCDKPDHPILYTRVDLFNDFIRETTGDKIAITEASRSKSCQFFPFVQHSFSLFFLFLNLLYFILF